MDTRNEIREFLTSRRARITPEQADLTWTATIDEEILVHLTIFNVEHGFCACAVAWRIP